MGLKPVSRTIGEHSPLKANGPVNIAIFTEYVMLSKLKPIFCNLYTLMMYLFNPTQDATQGQFLREVHFVPFQSFLSLGLDTLQKLRNPVNFTIYS